MKKVLSIVLALAMTMSLAACGSKDKPDDSKGSASSGAGTSASTPSTSGEPVEVLWWTAFGQANVDHLQKVIDAFNESQDAYHVTIEYQGNQTELNAKLVLWRT